MVIPINPYPGHSGVEPDLRFELNKMLTGGPGELAKGQFIILRIMRRAANAPIVPVHKDHLQPCDCVNDLYSEPDITYPCNVCEGEGFLFDDIFALAYKEERFEYIDTTEHEKGPNPTQGMSFFYVEYYQGELSKYDVVIEPQVDHEGNMISPTSYYLKHNIHMAQKMKSDQGRLEYWRLGTLTTPLPAP